MNAQELHHLLASGKAPLLLNVLPAEIHAARRIPGSANACVYEMAFSDQVAAVLPSKDAPVIVYGAGGGSRDAGVACEKLTAAGYSNVDVFQDGLEGWEKEGFSLEGSGGPPLAPDLHGEYRIDVAESVIRWTGRNLFNHHSGTVRLAGGGIVMDEGRLVSGRFVVDMNSIACEDLADQQWNAMLIRHLRDADFFEVDVYPAAEFIVNGAERIPGASEGTPNYVLKGCLTLRGVSRPLEFPAVIASADGKRLTGQAQVVIDRTDFGSIYGSGRFFRFLGKHVVNDHIHLHLKIHADSAG